MMTNIHHHWTYIIVTRISFFCCLSNLTFFSWIEIVFSSKIGSHMNERETVWWGSETCRESRVWPSFHRQTVLFVWQKRGTKQTETCCCKCVLQCLLVWQCKLRLAHDDVQSSESSWVRKEWKERERKRGNFLILPLYFLSLDSLLILSLAFCQERSDGEVCFPLAWLLSFFKAQDKFLSHKDFCILNLWFRLFFQFCLKVTWFLLDS